MEDRKVQPISENKPALYPESFVSLLRIGLILSAVLGLYIAGSRPLSLDDWSGANLIITGIVDVAFVLLVTFVPRLAAACVPSSILTTTLLAGDLLAIRLVNFHPWYFAWSLLGLVTFDALLITQFLIGIVSLFSTRRGKIAILESDEDIRRRAKSEG